VDVSGLLHYLNYCAREPLLRELVILRTAVILVDRVKYAGDTVSCIVEKVKSADIFKARCVWLSLQLAKERDEGIVALLAIGALGDAVDGESVRVVADKDDALRVALKAKRLYCEAHPLQVAAYSVRFVLMLVNLQYDDCVAEEEDGIAERPGFFGDGALEVDVVLALEVIAVEVEEVFNGALFELEMLDVVSCVPGALVGC